MMKYVRNIDFFGTNFNFTINQNEKYRTLFGSFLSICLIVLSIVFSIIFGNDLFNRKNPIVNFQNVIGQNFTKANLNSTNFFIPWAIQDFTGKNVDYSNLIYPHVYYFEINKTSSGEYKFNTKILKYSKCNPKYESIIKGISNFNCFEFDGNNMTIGGAWEADFLNYFEIGLYFCPNHGNYDPNGNCTSFEVLNSFFGYQIYFNIYYPKIHFDPEDTENPLKIEYINYFYQMSTGLIKTDRFYFEKVDLKDDKGIVFPDISMSSSYTQNQVISDYGYLDKVLYNSNNTWSVLYQSIFYLGKNTNYYSRSFIKLQSVAAQIGGFITVLELFCHLMAFFVNQYYRDLKLINQYFTFELTTFENSPNSILIQVDKSINQSKIDFINFQKDNQSHSDKVNHVNLIKSKDLIKKASEIEINDILNDIKIKSFTPSIFLYIKGFFSCLKGEDLNIFEIYKTAKEYIDYKLDLIQYLKIHETIDKFKSISFNDDQKLAMKYMNKINLSEKNNIEMIKKEIKPDKTREIKQIIDYFSDHKNQMLVDKKILMFLDKKILKSINKT